MYPHFLVPPQKNRTFKLLKSNKSLHINWLRNSATKWHDRCYIYPFRGIQLALKVLEHTIRDLLMGKITFDFDLDVCQFDVRI